MALATVTDVETVNGQAVASSDAPRVLRLLELASDVVRIHTGQTIDAVAADSAIILVGDGTDLLLPQRPVTAITSIKINGATILPAEYRWSRSGRVYRIPFGYGYGYQLPWYGREATVVYDHGYLTPPDWLSAIVASMVATALSTPSESRVLNLERVGSYEVRYRDSPDPLLTIPPQAKVLLRQKLGQTRVGTTVLPLIGSGSGSQISPDHR